MKTIYTIGYSGFSTDSFIDELKKYHISCIVDVRSTPYSHYFTSYNKNILEVILNTNKIFYRHYAKEFGAQQEDKKFYSKEGYLIFEKFIKSPLFLNGIDKIKRGMEQGYIFALMCAEKDPINCHRSIMVAREFYKLGYDVQNLLPNNIKQSQGELENRLLDKYYPNRNQLSLFNYNILTDSDLINEVYRKRNAEIGNVLEVNE